MSSANNLNKFLVVVSNCIKQPFCVTWCAGVIGGVVNDQCRQAHASSIINTIGIRLIITPL